jgi:uncharacterized protein (TIGR02217 family)
MAFYESPRFPERISYGAQGGPEWRTDVVVTAGGREQRNAAWTYPRHRWDVSQGIKSQADFETLRAHFMSVRGRLHGWRFKDWADFSAVHTSGFVTGLTSTTFQLVKRYTSGAQTLNRKIVKPIASGFELKNSGSTLTLTTDYTLNTVTGIVTTTASRTAANLTWAGEFDVPMRYDTDRLEGRIIGRNASGLLHEWSGIPILELVL